MDKKAKVILFVISYILGITAFLTANIVVFTTIFFIILTLLTIKNKISGKFAITLFLIFFVGIVNIFSKFQNSDYLQAIAPINNITVIGQVETLPSSASEDYTKFTLRTEKLLIKGEKPKEIKTKTLVTLLTKAEIYNNIEIGDKLSLTGRLVKTKPASNPSEFCYSTYLKFQQIHSRLYVQDCNFSILEKPKHGVFGFLASLNRIRNKIINLHSENIKSPELELLGGIVFGDDAVTPTPEMKTSFQHSGLTHIIAASGMNVSMIFGMWFFLSQILRLNYRVSIFIGMLSVICYTCMTGFGPPVLRASLMLLLILFGKMLDRKAESVSLLFIVAFLMLLFSPSMITNIGFQLSFSVTLGLLLTCPLIFDKIKNKIVNLLASFVFVPIIAQFFAAPVQMFYFNSFSPYSILANISVVPTLSVVSFLGFLSCIFATIKPIAYISVKIFDIIMLPFLSFITMVADFFSNLPYSNITVASPSIFQITVYFFCLLSLIFAFKYKDKMKIFFSIFVISLTLLLFSNISFKQNENEVIFFSVENADAALIKTSKKKYILIDTGKAPYKNFSSAAERIILKYFDDNGISKLDMLILSHFDSDHAGGAIPITEKVKVDTLAIKTDKSNQPLGQKIIKHAKINSIPIKIVKNNEIIFDDGENKISAIFSDKGDDNDKSIINVFETPNGNILFTGDSGVNSFSELKKYLPKNVKVLKVAHHGAKESVSDDYLNFINPENAIISTGTNIYGHPADNTINLLKKHNVKILRTDKDNAVKVVLQKNKILLYSYNNHRKKFERIKYDRKS